MPLKILILDYSIDRLAAAKIRQWLPEDAEIESFIVDAEFKFPAGWAPYGFTHIVHSGSARRITEYAPFMDAVGDVMRTACGCGIAQMGICYGHQLLCRILAGPQAVRSCPAGLEAGWRRVEFSKAGRDLLGVGQAESVYQNHFDEATRVPDGAEVIAENSHSRVQAFIDIKRNLLGVQFHPEMDRESGNRSFMKGAARLLEHGYRAEELVKDGPSLDAGKVFFGYFERLNIGTA